MILQNSPGIFHKHRFIPVETFNDLFTKSYRTCFFASFFKKRNCEKLVSEIYIIAYNSYNCINVKYLRIFKTLKVAYLEKVNKRLGPLPPRRVVNVQINSAGWNRVVSSMQKRTRLLLFPVETVG